MKGYMRRGKNHIKLVEHETINFINYPIYDCKL